MKAHRSIHVHTTVLMRFRLFTLKRTFDAERAMILLALIKMINLITAVKEEQNMFFLKLLTLIRERSICTRVAILKVYIGRSRVGDQRASMS